MSNFKSGSGNLDFGGSESDDEKNEEVDESEDKQEDGEPESAEKVTSSSQRDGSPDTERTTDNPTSGKRGSEQSATSRSPENKYPYFVRRSNIGDERDTRLEIHVRDKVAEQEAEFRNELAEQLDTNEVSKTDAREFALLAAFHHPERVAELMQDEGFGAIE